MFVDHSCLFYANAAEFFFGGELAYRAYDAESYVCVESRASDFLGDISNLT